MHRFRSKAARRSAFALAAASALALAATPALAQVKDVKDSYYDGSAEIIVTAPYVERRETYRENSAGAPIEELSMTAVVNASDLDLRYDYGVDELQRRVHETAVSLCDEVHDEAGVHAMSTERECVREATRDAMAQVNDLIAYRRS